MQAIELGHSGIHTLAFMGSSTGSFPMGATSCWRRPRTWPVAGVGAAIALVLALGAAPARADVGATYIITATFPTGKQSLPCTFTIKGQTPTSIAAPGDKVTMTGFQFAITLPPSFVNSIINAGGRMISGKVTVFNISATDAKVATVNAAGSGGIPIPLTTLVPNTSVTFKLPANAIPVGTWTASQTGIMSFNAGNIAFTIATRRGVNIGARQASPDRGGNYPEDHRQISLPPSRSGPNRCTRQAEH